MKLVRLKFRNFTSYGAAWQELEFEDDYSLNLIQGKNGWGKSSISNALLFSLYGKVPGKTLSELVNRINKKELETEIELISNGKKVLIQRGISPSYLKVFVNDSPVVGDTAGKLNVEDYLQDEIYNLPLSVFNNIVSLSIKDFKSFINMKKADKKIILDKIFGLFIINEMLEMAKKELKMIKNDEIKLSNSIQTLLEQSEMTSSKLEDLTNKLYETNQTRKDEIQVILDKITKNKETLTDNIKELIKNERELNETLYQKKDTLNELKTKLRFILKDIQLYENKICPTCKADLCTEEHENKKNDLLTEQLKIENKQSKILKNLSILEEKLVEISEEKSELKQLLYKIDNKNVQLLDELKKLNLNITDEQTKSLQDIIDNINSDIKDRENDLHSVKKQLSIFSKLEDILGDKGVKQYFVKNILPSLNGQIKKLLNDVDLEYKLTFDQEFDAHIKHLGQNISLSTLCSGEGVKLDFVVILSLIRLLKIKFPGLNILFLDEIFSSLDMDAQHHFVKLLSQTSKELNLHIYVVNHSPLESIYFTNTIKLEKTNSFSKFIINQNT